MLKENAYKLSEILKPEARVLDIGGWAMPFNRANYVIDIQPYETRGKFGHQGSSNEYFTPETWIVRDLCNHEPYPFPDKYFDCVICSHTLEDIRDPIWVCSEIIRIGKSGYIEMPSLESELTLGLENRRYVGRTHHRWLVEITDNKITFIFKPHKIHASWKYYVRNQNHIAQSAGAVQFLFWEHSFECEEQIMIPGKLLDDFLQSRALSIRGEISALRQVSYDIRDKLISLLMSF